LSSEGIVVAVLTVDMQGKLVTRPKIMSRGFVFEKDATNLFEKATQVIEKLTKPREGAIDYSKKRREIISTLEDFFYKERGRRPLVIVETIQI
jgi:ribonuclease J